MNEIILYSRYGDKHKLIQLTDNNYKIEPAKNTNLRIGFDDNNNIEFIDFEGGPFLKINNILDNKKIQSFKFIDNIGYILKFK